MRIPPLLASLPLLGGCATISLAPVSSTEEVVSSRQEVVPGQGVRVRAAIDGTRIALRTVRGCKRIEQQTVRVEEVLEADESIAEEVVSFTVGAIPLGIGVGLLADAPNVYSSDRNSRTYNSTGPTGAYVAGTVLTTIGGLFILPATVELLRIAAAGEVETRVTEREGRVLDANVECFGGGDPIRTSVVLRAGAQVVPTPGTGADGTLTLDVADAVSREVAEQAVVVEVVVADQVVGELDVGPILEVHRRRARERDAEAWSQIDPQRCAEAPPEDATSCRALESYLVRFPDGAHAAEAKAILDERRDLTLARPPADPKESCQAACERDCDDGDEACAARCREEVCR